MQKKNQTKMEKTGSHFVVFDPQTREQLIRHELLLK